MKCERCGLCCYDAPCGCGHGKEDEKYHCNNFRVRDGKAICLGIEDDILKGEDIGIGEGCSYYIKGGRFAEEHPKYAKKRLIEITKYFEEDKKDYVWSNPR